MWTIRSVLISLALLTLLAIPALGQEQETVTQTFKLTLYGDVPEGETFRVLVAEEGSFDFAAVTFCGGPKPGTPPGPEDTECVGNGTTYTQTLRLFPAGTDIKFTFGREPAGEQNLEAFFKATATIPTEESISAHYTFGGDDQESGDADQQMPEKMPSTGAGGLARSSIPLAVPLAALPFLTAAAHAVLRRQ